MRCVILLAALVLAGCAATEVQTQKVLVPVPCDPERPQRPAWAVDSLPLGSDIDVQMRALRADRHRAKGYISELEAAISSCGE